ncbi:MAG: hypothetical protein WKF47_12695 [Geodermatophilaceae bacterium]
MDIEYRFRFAGSEWVSWRASPAGPHFDLTIHSEKSGADLSYFDQEEGRALDAVRDRTCRRCRPLPMMAFPSTPTPRTRR